VNNNNKDIEQQHQHLTQFELDGLQTLCSLLRKLKEKSIPEDLIQTQLLLEAMEVHFCQNMTMSIDPMKRYLHKKNNNPLDLTFFFSCSSSVFLLIMLLTILNYQ
jgi:hypothetical protein